MFIARIARANGRFYKVPRAPCMPAVPPSTTVSNYNTYFRPWSRRFSTYIMGEDAATQQNSTAVPGLSKIVRSPVTLRSLQAMSANSAVDAHKIAMITAHDAVSAAVADECGADIVLVGDSCANTVLGYDDTNPVTMQEMLVVAKAVARKVDYALKVGDMPFGSYVTPELALANAALFVKEGRMDMVKLEGGRRVAPIVRALADAGIAVMGHIGLTPQSAVSIGGYRRQGVNSAEALALIDDAQALEEAGAKLIVLECVPPELAALITEKVNVPTIGIGSGKSTSGQVLVFSDVVGITRQSPSFVRRYGEVYQHMGDAVAQYIKETRDGQFPYQEHAKPMPKKALANVQKALAQMEAPNGAKDAPPTHYASAAPNTAAAGVIVGFVLAAGVLSVPERTDRARTGTAQCGAVCTVGVHGGRPVDGRIAAC